MLGARSQSEVPATADEIFLAVAKGGRVFVANTKEFKAVGPIAACDTIRGDLVEQTRGAAAAPGLDDKARQQKADALSAKAETEFLRLHRECPARQQLRRRGRRRAGATGTAAAAVIATPLCGKGTIGTHHTLWTSCAITAGAMKAGAPACFYRRPCTSLFDGAAVIRSSAGGRTARGCRLRLTHGATRPLLAHGVIERLRAGLMVLVHHRPVGRAWSGRRGVRPEPQ